MIFGILNITADSFSDGGKYLDPAAAIAHGKALMAEGADALDIGAASSNPNPAGVPPKWRSRGSKPCCRRSHGFSDLDRQLFAAGAALGAGTGRRLSQRHRGLRRAGALSRARGIEREADRDAFGAAARRRHAVTFRPRAIMERVIAFFDERSTALERAGIARDRLILDPGMGFFLGSDGEASFTVLRNLRSSRRATVCRYWSRCRANRFCGTYGRAAAETGTASLAAELFAVRQGADYIRTHAPGALRDALTVTDALTGPDGG